MVTRWLTRMRDGTVKQVNAFTGTQVWTVPGRGDRPLVTAERAASPLAPGDAGRMCAFCSQRYVETPPEIARIVHEGDAWRTMRQVGAADLDRSVAAFRLVPNLFEIMSLDYWRDNHGYVLPEAELARRRAYLRDPAGREQVIRLLSRSRPTLARADDESIARSSIFGGFHDVVIAQRHVVDGALFDDQLASSGTLTASEHAHYLGMTFEAARRLYATNEHARNVVIFQNWLRPAGASFDHLHKQLVAIDELGTSRMSDIRHLDANPDLVQEYRTLLRDNGLVIAESDSAVLVAGVGHRFPSLEVWTERHDCDLWNISEAEFGDLSDLLHAAHVAMGPTLPVNEEWHYRPPVMRERLPIRVVIKWRISTPAGFEGGSGIFVNTLDPWAVAERTRTWLSQKASQLSPGVRLVV